MVCGVFILPGSFAAVTPLHEPIAVLVVFRDARIDVAVADIDVARRIPCHIGDLAEQTVDRRKRRIGMLQRMSALVRGFGLAAQIITGRPWG